MEKEKPQIQLSVDANSYIITGVNMGFDEELFHFMIASANQGRQFTATPEHVPIIKF